MLLLARDAFPLELDLTGFFNNSGLSLGVTCSEKNLTSLTEHVLPPPTGVTVDSLTIDVTEQYEILLLVEFFASLVSDSPARMSTLAVIFTSRFHCSIIPITAHTHKAAKSWQALH